MGILNKAAILQSDDRPVTPVECPEWGGSVCVRGLTGAEREVFTEQVDDSSRTSAALLLFRLGTCEKGGERLNWTPVELSKLAEKNAAPLFRVAEKVGDLSGLTAKAVEEVEGNS